MQCQIRASDMTIQWHHDIQDVQTILFALCIFSRLRALFYRPFCPEIQKQLCTNIMTNLDDLFSCLKDLLNFELEAENSVNPLTKSNTVSKSTLNTFYIISIMSKDQSSTGNELVWCRHNRAKVRYQKLVKIMFKYIVSV